MNRTIEQIFEELKAEGLRLATEQNNVAALAMFNNTSRVAIWRILFYTVAFCVWSLENIVAAFKNVTEQNLRELKPHSVKWYINMALAYQHGFNLMPESDKYDNSGIGDGVIAAAKKIKYAAVQEQINQFGRVSLRMKLAGTIGNDLKQLEHDELAGVRAYFARVKDAGVALNVTSDVADELRMKWDIYYDPLILNNQGQRLDGTDSEPVQKAIRAFLQQITFNGVYVPTYHIDAVQTVPGVVYPIIREAAAKYGNLPFTSLSNEYQPDAGYLRFENSLHFSDPNAALQINFIPRQAL